MKCMRFFGGVSVCSVLLSGLLITSAPVMATSAEPDIMPLDLRPDWTESQWKDYYTNAWEALADVARGGAMSSLEDAIVGTVGVALAYAGYLGAMGEAYAPVEQTVVATGHMDYKIQASDPTKTTGFTMMAANGYQLTNVNALPVFQSEPFTFYVEANSVNVPVSLYADIGTLCTVGVNSAGSLWCNASPNAIQRYPNTGVAAIVVSPYKPTNPIYNGIVQTGSLLTFRSDYNYLGSLNNAGAFIVSGSDITAPDNDFNYKLPDGNFYYDEPLEYINIVVEDMKEKYPDYEDGIDVMLQYFTDPIEEDNPNLPGCGCCCGGDHGDVNVDVQWPTYDVTDVPEPSDFDFGVLETVETDEPIEYDSGSIPEDVISGAEFWFHLMDTVADMYKVKALVISILIIALLLFFIAR